MLNIKKIKNFVGVSFIAFALSSCASTEDEIIPASVYYNDGLKYYLKGFTDKTEEELLKVLNEYPLSPYAVEAQILLADAYYEAGRYDEASSYYGTFHTLHPSHNKAEYALFQKAMSHFKLVLALDRDQGATKKALFGFEEFLITYPASLYSLRAREISSLMKNRLADNEFFIGHFYFKNKNYEGALFRFGEILRQYPTTTDLDKALYYIGLTYEALGEEDRADESFENLMNTFPDSKYINEINGNTGS